jgi:hydrogenase nickel incorporation protein HypA/HybF
MHELSIAMSLVDVACAEAERLGSQIDALYLRIGVLSGVVVEALEFSFDIAAAGRTIEGAKLIIERIPITARCPRCEAERIIPSMQHLRCPVCSTPTPDIVRGTELELFAMEVHEGAATYR